ncbi:MAG TPA: phosphoribosyltransferase family protein [Nitrososphaera sp.]|jgi:hypoxanthine phosphoribosyltransferase
MKQGINPYGEEVCSWQEIECLVREIAIQVKKSGVGYNCILAITRGGIVPARLLSRELGIDAIQFIPVRNKTVIKSEMPALDIGKQYLVIDDIYDTGDTFHKVANVLNGFNCDYCFCMSRHKSHGITAKVLDHNKWIVFPWE